MSIEIKNRYTKKIILVVEGANLEGANLYGANLRSADLRSANLYGANLYGADLRSADLYGANLEGADLYGANLEGADLYGANLEGADLYGANLYGANLEGADLYGADLRCMGDMKYICTMQVDTYLIGFTKDILQIGTKAHTIEAWKLFNEDVTSNIDIPFLGWWGKWKEIIFKIIDRSGVEQ